MKEVIYTCPYVPAEWIAAHGLAPSRIIPAASPSVGCAEPTEGVCPYVHSFINEVFNDTQSSGVVVTTLCDQMRRAFEIIASRCDTPAFLMNVPNTWQHAGAHNLYLDELKRLGRFLIRIGGKPPSNDLLTKTMIKYDSERRNAFADSPPQTNGIPLAILGGPLLKDDIQIFDLVERSGGCIVLDATETGEFGMCARFNYKKTKADPLTELAGAYLGGIAHPSQRPNSPFYNWLGSRLVERKVRGIIFRRYVWCDIWHAELYRLKQWTQLPILDIDVTAEAHVPPVRTETRIGAFLEMLR